MRKKYIFAFLALVCFFLPVHGYCSEKTYTLTAEQMEALQSNLTALERNNNLLLSLLQQSNLDLRTASDNLTTSEQELTTLRTQLTESQSQIATLRQQLTVLQQESASAKESLEIANQDLQSAIESCKTLEDRQRRIENQRIFWQIVSGILGIAFAAK